jgi:hypothetical protein
MRFSIFAAFMLPLATLAAPTPPGFTQALQNAIGRFRQGLDLAIARMEDIREVASGDLANKANGASKIVADASTAFENFSSDPSLNR